MQHQLPAYHLPIKRMIAPGSGSTLGMAKLQLKIDQSSLYRKDIEYNYITDQSFFENVNNSTTTDSKI